MISPKFSWARISSRRQASRSLEPHLFLLHQHRSLMPMNVLRVHFPPAPAFGQRPISGGPPLLSQLWLSTNSLIGLSDSNALQP